MTIKDNDGTIEAEGSPAVFIADDTGASGTERRYASDSGSAVVKDSTGTDIHVVEQAYLEQSLQQQFYTALAADSAGEKAVTRHVKQARAAYLDNAQAVYLVGAIDATTMGGSATIEVELYDETSPTADVALESVTVSGTGYQVFGASGDISGALGSGNLYTARWNVTTASGTAGDDFDALDARLIYL